MQFGLFSIPSQRVSTKAPVGDRYLDSLELAFELQDQPLGHARAEAVKNGGPRGDGGIAAMHEFLQGLDEAGRRRGGAGRIASMRASTVSGLARAPMASANRRERNGLTMATAKPPALRLR